MKSFYTILAFIFLYGLPSYAQWEWEYPVPQGNSLNELNFPEASQQIGYACGDHGTIMKTTDGGENWTVLDSITNLHLKGLDFINENLGYFAGDSGMIIRYDGGIMQKENSATHYNLFDIGMSSANNIIAIGYQGLILRSSGDGNWSLVNTGVYNTLYAVSFVNADLGFIVGDTGTILKTTDAGASWNKINVPFETAFNDVYFVNATTGFIVGNKHVVLKTTDGGATWQQNTQVPTEENIYSIHFANDTSGYLCGANGLVLSTFNGGASWGIKNIVTTLTFRSIVMQNTYEQIDTVVLCDNEVFCGDNGVIYRTDTCGHFANKTHGSNRSLNTIEFLGDTLAYGVGGYLFSKTPLVIKGDGAGNWEELMVDTIFKQYLTDICLINSDTGYITGTNGRLFRADSILVNWQPLKTNVSKTLYSVRFATPTKGMAVGRDGLLLKSIDNTDTNWVKVESPYVKSLYKLHYEDVDKGAFAVGDDGMILRIKNNANNLSKVPSGTSVPLYDIKFPSDTVGFVVGFDGKILKLKMVNGEVNEVVSIPSGVTVPLNEIYFPSPMTGYIAGEGGTILESTDGGNSWLPTLTGTSNNFRDLYFKTDNIGWAIGSGPMIMKTINGGGPVVTPYIEENKFVARQLKLYPNPARGVTQIEYTLNDRGPVQISAYDLSGRQIKVFKKDVQGKGLHSEQLNIAGLTKGIYLLIIQTGNEHKAEKLVVFE
ncbi:MAG TPA: YCF48-related protein [Bacteroidales bacterium]|nr:YCF48-related protein [Bacteroidales bacterium]HRX98023.1 YCF48-related protein [Bacteroidales bacterium]